ncbi:uncharacterized protein BJ171DRAFT_488646 [Polychytrium aggregatum]|uniref:uncharacterized protein n=1 Tax=Polychytrium aggregatum TaxID=110093 RepID=UPI0022FE5FF1|nr:uncharacterized protein BJ171DRAFT_488646 [Polychytrium aggregatum]KAI9209150.1 hypothetical protein BJ171DRAFT_488646 [Polychytrium aggregatum]
MSLFLDCAVPAVSLASLALAGLLHIPDSFIQTHHTSFLAAALGVHSLLELWNQSLLVKHSRLIQRKQPSAGPHPARLLTHFHWGFFYLVAAGVVSTGVFLHGPAFVQQHRSLLQLVFQSLWVTDLVPDIVWTALPQSVFSAPSLHFAVESVVSLVALEWFPGSSIGSGILAIVITQLALDRLAQLWVLTSHLWVDFHRYNLDEGVSLDSSTAEKHADSPSTKTLHHQHQLGSLDKLILTLSKRQLIVFNGALFTFYIYGLKVMLIFSASLLYIQHFASTLETSGSWYYPILCVVCLWFNLDQHALNVLSHLQLY